MCTVYHWMNTFSMCVNCVSFNEQIDYCTVLQILNWQWFNSWPLSVFPILSSVLSQFKLFDLLYSLTCSFHCNVCRMLVICREHHWVYEFSCQNSALKILRHSTTLLLFRQPASRKQRTGCINDTLWSLAHTSESLYMTCTLCNSKGMKKKKKGLSPDLNQVRVSV